jgi:integrase/recombinase XerD
MCDCLGDWAAWMRAIGQSPRTLRLRIGTVQRTARHVGKHACEISTMDMINSLDRAMSAWSRSTYVGSLHAWGRWLVQTGRREQDPAAGLPKPRNPKTVPRPISEHDTQKIIRSASGRELIMILLAAYAGLRVHEVAKIRGEDISEESLYVEGKGGVIAMIPTHPLIWEAAASLPREGWWFPSRQGDGPLTSHAVGLIMAATIRGAGVNGTAHQLRHRYGTAVLRASGGNLRVAQELLRHASPATTAGYTLVEDSEKRSAVLALA